MYNTFFSPTNGNTLLYNISSSNGFKHMVFTFKIHLAAEQKPKRNYLMEQSCLISSGMRNEGMWRAWRNPGSVQVREAPGKAAQRRQFGPSDYKIWRKETARIIGHMFVSLQWKKILWEEERTVGQNWSKQLGYQ